jgi:2-hydroxy-3-keto-5-methylthiopentenyl-1-phosphate phosphatase
LDNNQFRRILFCDFDGTITSIETFVEMFRTIVPQHMAEIIPELKAFRMTLREGVSRLLESIPSERYEEVLATVRDRERRDGFEELIDFLDSKGVPLVVISGGLECLVRENLGELTERVHSIFAARVETDGEFLRPVSRWLGDTELVSKVKVMEQFRYDQSVAIGDGITDFYMAEKADLVFARDGLARYLSDKGVPYEPWEDFFDVIRYLEIAWND